jgi:hypothetical protein
MSSVASSARSGSSSMRDRRAEDRHDGIAHELLDEAAAVLDRLRRISNSAFWKARTSSGSSSSASAVKPVRSAKTTVTVRRSAGAASTAAGAGMPWPQRGQNAAAGGVVAPQCAQVVVMPSLLARACCRTSGGAAMGNRRPGSPLTATRRRPAARSLRDRRFAPSPRLRGERSEGPGWGEGPRLRVSHPER